MPHNFFPFGIGLAGFFSLLMISPAGAAAPTAVSAPKKAVSAGGTLVNGIVATVNGRVITYSEWRKTVDSTRQMIAISLRGQPEEARKKLADLESESLDNLIERELILQEFAKMGGTLKPQYLDDDVNGIVRDQFKGNREQFNTELAKSGMTLKGFRELREKALIVGFMRAQKTRGLPAPTPVQIKEFYDKNIDQFRLKNYAKISTISIPKYVGAANATPATQRKLAEEVRAKVAKGSGFAAAAKTYSSDSRAAAGGSMDWNERAEMDQTIASVVFNTKAGGITPVIELPGAYVICYVEAKKPGETKPLDEVKPLIVRALQGEQSKGIMDKWVAELRKSANIKKMN